MRLLEPVTFTDQPYVAGLNQGAHAVAGAAVLCAFLLVFHVRDALCLALVSTRGLELWQLRSRGAFLWDMLLDLFFWNLGSLCWAWAVIWAFVTGPAIFFPLWLTPIMGAVMAVFTLFKRASKEP